MTATDIARPRFARMYLRSAASAEERGATDHRRRLLEGLSGTVVEIGAGHGLNFPLYPAEVTEVVAIEPEPTLRSEAETAAESAKLPIRVLAGVADELPLADEGADAAVASLVLCSVPDQQRALGEIRRVLRPDGELRFYEHVIPRCQPKRLLLQLIDRSGIWPAIAGGCHPARDTTKAIMQAGFRHRGNRALRLLGPALRAADPAHPRDRPSDLIQAAAPPARQGRLPALEPRMLGVFASGNVRHGSVKRAASAVVEGSIAIQLIHSLVAADQPKGSHTAKERRGRAHGSPVADQPVRGHRRHAQRNSPGPDALGTTALPSHRAFHEERPAFADLSE
jgi:ubiquinone/menaquinone biosynthesis C-methylase UbiE